MFRPFGRSLLPTWAAIFVRRVGSTEVRMVRLVAYFNAKSMTVCSKSCFQRDPPSLILKGEWGNSSPTFQMPKIEDATLSCLTCGGVGLIIWHRSKEPVPAT